MKKHLFTLLLSLVVFTSVAQSSQVQSAKLVRFENGVDSLLALTQANTYNSYILQSVDMSKKRYKLYQTDNIYNLLQLDTETGMLEQVQWALETEKEGSSVINSIDLATDDSGFGPGTFELYPTKNMFQFILINQVTGTKWHVQWGFKAEDRWIRRIY